METCVTCGGPSEKLVGGLAGQRSRMVRFSVPGTLPSMSMYGPLTGPYLVKPPFGVISFPSVPILSMRLLYSVL